jgi:hypothetical protein
VIISSMTSCTVLEFRFSDISCLCRVCIDRLIKIFAENGDMM